MASKKIITGGGTHGDGVQLGEAATDKVGLWGATPVVQPSGATQAAITDSSGGTASDTIADVPASYNEAQLANAFATLAAKYNALRTALVAAGIIKGSA